MSTLVRPSLRTIAWLPAAALLTAGVLAAAGFTGISSSNAASAGSTTVTATVAKEVHMALDTAGNCGAAGGSTTTRALTGTSMTTADNDVSLASCRMTFGSNNNSTSGATLYVESSRTSGGNHLCTTAPTSACVAPTFTDVSTAGEAPATFATGETANAGKFGIKANIISTSCTGGMGGSANYFGLLPNTDGTPGANVCSTGSTTDGTVDIDFRVNPGSSQPASTSYQVETLFTATAD